MKTPVHVDLWYSATWNDITSDVRCTPEHQIMISGGQQNWLSRVSPTKCDLALINTIIHPGEDPTKIGKYSPRNPNSPLNGLIGRNTPLRVYVRWLADGYGRTVASGWGTSDSHLDSNRKETAIVGSLAWTTTGSGTGSSAVGSGVATHTQTDADGFRLSYLASGANIRDCEVRAVVTADEANIDGGNIQPGNLVLRLVDADNYYYARVQVTTAEVVQIGLRKVVATVDSEIAAPVTVDGLTYTGQQLAVAFLADGPHLAAKVWDPAVGEAFAWQITATDTSLTAAGAPGVRSGVASGSTDVPVTFTYDNLEVRSYRFNGEVEAFPQEWTLDADEDGNGVVWAPLVAYGLMYRLGLPGQDVLARSALRRYIETQGGYLAFWALDDGELAVSGALTDGTGGALSTVEAPSVTLRAGTDEVAPWLGTGLTIAPDASGGSALVAATIPLPAAPTRLVVDATYLWRFTDDTQEVITFALTDTASGAFGGGSGWAAAVLVTTGTASILAGRLPLSPGHPVDVTTDVALPPSPHHIRLDLTQDGADVDIAVYIDGVLADSGTDTADNLNSLGYARLGYTGGGSATITDLVVYSNVTPPSVTDAATAAMGHAGETSAARVTRVCAEEDIEAFVFGTGQLMGPQPVAPPLEMFIGSGEVRDTDGGVFGEPRHTLGFRFVAYDSLLNQDPTLTLDYASAEVAPPLVHREDLDHCQNDVIVTRRYGSSSARLLQESGPLNVSAPHTDPNGVGHYPVRPELNLAEDLQVGNAAGRIRLHGTTDGLRFAALGVDFTALYHAGKAALIGDVLAVDPGDKLIVENVPAWLGGGDTEQIQRGFTEMLGPFHWLIEHVTSPYDPYVVGVYVDDASPGSDPDRYAAVGSSLYAAVDDNDLSLSVVPGTRRWTTTAAHMNPDMQVRVAPIEGLPGEVMEISAVANAASFVAAGTAASAVNAAVSPGAPAGKAVGDCLLLFAGVSDAALTPPTITGWNGPLGTGLTKAGIYSREADGTATDTPTVTFAGTGAGDTVIAQIAAFRGVAVPTSIDDLAGDSGIQSNSSAQNIAHPALTITQDLAVGILFAFKNDDWTSVAAAAAFTEIGEPDLATGDDFGLWWGYALQTAATNFATGTITVTGGASATSAARIYALRGLQTLTVSARSVNGVVKSHAAGSEIQLARLARYSPPAESSGSAIVTGEALVSPTAPSLGPLAGAFLDELYPYAAGDRLIPPRGFTSDGSSGNYASTPDTSALDITGDITLECELSPDDWTPAAFDVVLGKYVGSSNNRSYYLGISTGGAIVIGWSTLGTGVTEVTRSSTEVITLGTGERLAIKATLDVNNGAAGHTARFYTATSIDGPWTQLGSDVVTAGTTSIFSSTAALTVGGVDAGTTAPFAGIVHIARVRNGIDGSIVANVRFLDEIPGTTSFVDETSLTWTINGAAVIS